MWRWVLAGLAGAGAGAALGYWLGAREKSQEPKDKPTDKPAAVKVEIPYAILRELAVDPQEIQEILEMTKRKSK